MQSHKKRKGKNVAAILAQKMMLTIQNGKVVRAVLCNLIQKHQGKPVWEESGELLIIDDGLSVAFPIPNDMWKDRDDARRALKQEERE